MDELEDLDAHAALARFGDWGGVLEELVTEDGKPYRIRTWARTSSDDTVVLQVSVHPSPWPDRRGLLGVVDAWRYGRHTRRSVQVRKVAP